ASEIEGKASCNIHMREERNRLTDRDMAIGEEERFSGVLGTGGMAPGTSHPYCGNTLNNGSHTTHPRG
ncbi:unnamed protein product, partial [Discosporangium mesarthrocarpum]